MPTAVKRTSKEMRRQDGVPGRPGEAGISLGL
jgi:hypothetical protein